MILVDTSVWIDHLRSSNAILSDLLRQRQVLTHPLMIGELAMGSMKQREMTLQFLHKMPRVTAGHDDEVMRFITRNKLFGLGLGYIDAHLLVAALLTPGTLLWTRDKRLFEIAQSLSLVYQPAIQ